MAPTEKPKKLKEQRQALDMSLEAAVLAAVLAYEDSTGYRVVSLSITQGSNRKIRVKVI